MNKETKQETREIEVKKYGKYSEMSCFEGLDANDSAVEKAVQIIAERYGLEKAKA